MTDSRPSEPLRSIHVGVGRRGKRHVQAAMESGYWRPVALVDVVPDYVTAARELTGLPEAVSFTTVEDAVGAVESDAVIVATPVTLHAAQILTALGADRHVLTEKCFTTSYADAVRCVAAADEHDRRLMVVQNARLQAPMRTLRRLVAEERYGPLGLYMMNFYKPRGLAYNMSPHMHLWQQGVHELDTILSVVQRPLRRVWGLSNNPAWSDWPSPCTFQAIAEYDGDVSGTYLGTSNARGPGFEFRLECAEAALIADRAAGEIQVRFGPHNQHDETVPLDKPDVHGIEDHPAAKAALAGEPATREHASLADVQIYRDFYEYIAEGKEPETTGRRNLETIAFVEAVQRSTELGRAVDISELGGAAS
ncbi:MAG: hypothetical protein CL878_10300 [Dehalococcoidia bacterium]|nr:hypothetical protein [Dehalococcoidia bacterium]